MEYWLEEPPTHVILALRYLGQRKPLTEQEARDQISEVGGMLGQAPAPMPPHLREMAEWADGLASKLKGKPDGRKP